MLFLAGREWRRLKACPLLAAHGQYSYHQAWSSMLTDMPDSLPGVQTNFWFPEHSDLLFPAGAVVSYLLACSSEPRAALKDPLKAQRCSCCYQTM